MSEDTYTLALISDVFHEDKDGERLRARLEEAKARGADLAVLPELPLNRWAPATKESRDEDAEAPGGPLHMLQSEAARSVGVGLVGGAIVRDPATGIRRNTALLFSSDGELVGTFAKCHIPEEPGFWETSHYEQGEEVAPVFDGLGVKLAVQICSDLNRPEASHLAAAQGAELIVNPRATELATYERWRHVFIANALTSACFVASVNRPAPEAGVLLGGPSFVASPDGGTLLETTEPVGVVELDRRIVRDSKRLYPGYLPVRAAAYAEVWRQIAEQADPVVEGYPDRARR